MGLGLTVMAATVITVLMATGCSDAPAAEGPAQALQAFLRSMDRGVMRRGTGGEFVTDDDSMREAYSLLDAASRDELVRRAELATSLGGQRIEAWEMIPPGRYRLRFEPREYQVDIAPDGRTADVQVIGAEGESAVVPMVREAEGWRIRLGLLPQRAPQ